MPGFNEFHVGENITHRAGGILTALSQSKEDITARQTKVAGILERRSGITLREGEGGEVFGNLSAVCESNIGRVQRLLQENSVLIDALHYFESEVTTYWKNISDITNTISLLKIDIMTADPERKAAIYNFIDINIGEIVFDLTHDLKLGLWRATDEEQRQLSSLSTARESFLSFVNKPRAVMIGGR